MDGFTASIEYSRIDQRYHAVAQHLGLNSEIFVIRKLQKDCIGDSRSRAAAWPVFYQPGHVSPDSMMDFRDGDGLQFTKGP